MASTSIIDRISDKIFGSPLAIKVSAELAEETAAARRALAADLATEETALRDAIGRHAVARVPLQANVDRLEASLSTARACLFEIDRAHRLVVWTAGQTLDRLRHQLRASASPTIHAFTVELRMLADAAWKQLDEVTERRVDNKVYTVWSNRRSVIATVAAIRHLLSNELGEEAPIWGLPLNTEALTAHLDALRATVPAIEGRPEKYQSLA